MADPKDLQKAADAIHEVRGLAAVQLHKELDNPLRRGSRSRHSGEPAGAQIKSILERDVHYHVAVYPTHTTLPASYARHFSLLDLSIFEQYRTPQTCPASSLCSNT